MEKLIVHQEMMGYLPMEIFVISHVKMDSSCMAVILRSVELGGVEHIGLAMMLCVRKVWLSYT